VEPRPDGGESEAYRGRILKPGGGESTWRKYSLQRGASLVPRPNGGVLRPDGGKSGVEEATFYGGFPGPTLLAEGIIRLGFFSMAPFNGPSNRGELRRE
jgi:hypothetical protein